MIRDWLHERLSRGRTDERIHECRRCGEVVDGSRSHCPACGHTGIATYEIG